MLSSPAVHSNGSLKLVDPARGQWYQILNVKRGNIKGGPATSTCTKSGSSHSRNWAVLGELGACQHAVVGTQEKAALSNSYRLGMADQLIIGEACIFLHESKRRL